VLFGEPHIVAVESTLDFLYDERHPELKLNTGALSRGSSDDAGPAIVALRRFEIYTILGTTSRSLRLGM
jgi:hypothetical protein